MPVASRARAKVFRVTVNTSLLACARRDPPRIQSSANLLVIAGSGTVQRSPTENTAPESGTNSEPGIIYGAATPAPNGLNHCNPATIRASWPHADDGTRIASLLQHNAARTPMKNLVPEHLGWRIKPGILGQ
ncbi:MAG TPA: hypothetical protein VLH36_12830, partial [Steroidobacteraceae bacterium]|nr:hypothetical protein [Steroidobacteraceae bacterium]